MRDLPKDLHWLLFDLDGTLTDSAPGILRCVPEYRSCWNG